MIIIMGKSNISKMGLFSQVIFNFSNGIKYCNFGDTILNIALDYHHGQELRQEVAMFSQVILFHLFSRNIPILQIIDNKISTGSQPN